MKTFQPEQAPVSLRVAAVIMTVLNFDIFVVLPSTAPSDNLVFAAVAAARSGLAALGLALA